MATRKHILLTLDSKVKVIRQHEKGIGSRQLAAELRHILFLMNEARTASDIVKKVTVLDAILWLTTAWDSVSPETIQKCFRKCGLSDAIVDVSSDDEWDEEDLRPLLPPGTSLRDYVNSDDHVATQRTNDDNWERALIDDAKVDTDGEAESSSEDSDEGGEKVVSSTTAWSHSSDLLNYALSSNN